MSTLGEAFIDIRARSGAFKAELVDQLRPVLAEVEAQAQKASGAVGKAGAAAATTVVKAAEAAGEAQIAENVKVAESAKALAKAIVDAERRAYAEGERLARESAAAKIKADKAVVASADKAAADITAAAKSANDAILLSDRIKLAEQATRARASVAFAREEADAAKANAATVSALNKAVAAEQKLIAEQLATALHLLRQRQAQDAKTVGDVETAVAKAAAAQQAAIASDLQTALRLLRQRQAQEAKAAADAETAIAKAAAAQQSAIAGQLQTALALLRQRQAQEAKAAADAESAIAAAAAARQTAIAGQLQTALALLRQRQAQEAKAAADAEVAIASQLANRLALLRQRQAAETKAAYDQQVAAAAAAAERIKALQSRIASSGAFGQAAKASQIATLGLGSAIDKVGSSLKSLPSNAFSGILTGAKFATIGVFALGAAIAGIGLKAAADLQSAQVAFTALEDNIKAPVQVINEVTDALGKTKEVATTLESGFDATSFLQTLRDIAQESTLAFNTLSSTSQQLLALDYNGKQVKDTLLIVGNALAASGKNGGELNESLSGVVTAFAQIKGAGRLLAQDLNQITTRIPSATRVKVYKQLAVDLGLASSIAKVTAKDIADVRSKAEQGKIGSDTGIKAILQVLTEVKGASADAKTGLNALQRQTEQTLPGAFESLKDTVRLSLGDIFTGLADKITKQLPALTDTIVSSLKGAAPALEKATDALFKNLPGLVSGLATAIGGAFNLLTAVLTAVGPYLDDIFAALGAIFTAAQELGPVFGPIFDSLVGAVKAVVEALPDVLTLIGGIGVSLAPAISIASSLLQIILSLSPLMAGIGQAFAALGVVLTPIAAVLKPVAEFIAGIFNNEVVQQILQFVGAFAAVFAGFAGAQILIAAVVAGVGALTTALGALAVALLANPVGLVIAGLVALGIAFYKAWTASETFRKIVVGAFKLIAIGVTAPLRLVLEEIELVASTLADIAHKVPIIGGKLGGGFDKAAGAADAANDKIGELIGSIDRIPTEKTVNINVKFNEFGFPIDPATGGAIQGPGLSTKDQELAASLKAAAEAKRIADALKITDSVADTFSGKNDALGKAEDKAAAAAKKKAEAAKKRAETFAQAIRDILKGLDSDFKKILVDGTRKQIDTALDSLVKKIAAAYKAAGKVRPTALIKRIERDNERLKDLADKRDKILDKLADATARRDEVSDQINSFGAITALGLEGIATAAGKAKTALADLSRLRIILPGQDALNVTTPGAAAKAALKASARDFADALKLRLKLIQEFQANIKKLIDKGLNKQTIDEIISAGPEAGGGIANSLASASKATIDSINDSQKAIAKAGKELGNTAADSLFRAGKSVVDGLIAGLKDKRDEIKEAMRDIADALVAQIKKVLKIKSPSQVLAAVGRFAGTGLHQGLTATSPAVVKAAAGLAKAAIPTLSPVSIPGLQKLAAAQAQVELAGALALPSPTSKSPTGPVSTTTNHREIHAPITQHFNVPSTDPRAFAAHMNAAAARAVR